MFGTQKKTHAAEAARGSFSQGTAILRESAGSVNLVLWTAHVGQKESPRRCLGAMDRRGPVLQRVCLCRPHLCWDDCACAERFCRRRLPVAVARAQMPRRWRACCRSDWNLMLHVGSFWQLSKPLLWKLHCGALNWGAASHLSTASWPWREWSAAGRPSERGQLNGPAGAGKSRYYSCISIIYLAAAIISATYSQLTK